MRLVEFGQKEDFQPLDRGCAFPQFYENGDRYTWWNPMDFNLRYWMQFIQWSELEFGFKEEMSYIIQNLRRLKKRCLTSATNLAEIPEFTGVWEPIVLDFLHQNAPLEKRLQLTYLRAPDTDKLQILFELICYLKNTPSLVFCNHRDAVERISVLLAEHGLAHGIFHGGMDQEDRERALIKFRNGSYRMLITTDLASRGLDIPEIGAVIHYQLPPTPEVFTHRNGRTARMLADGIAYLLLSQDDHLPPFLEEEPPLLTLPEFSSLPEPTPFQTLYIAAGKKDKINKTDIVGLLLQKGNLDKEDLGKIEVLDFSAYAAVATGKIDDVIERIKHEKIKTKKVRFALSD
jgi:ATP-independent RNA helicase DbpA